MSGEEFPVEFTRSFPVFPQKMRLVGKLAFIRQKCSNRSTILTKHD